MLNSRHSFLQRDFLIFMLIGLFFTVIVFKAVQVQIIQADFLVSEGSKRQIRTLKIPAPRGDILDRNGNLLALSTPIDAITIDPKIISFYLDKKFQYKKLLLEQPNIPAIELDKWHKNFDSNLQKYRQMLRVLNLSESTLTPKILAKKNKRFMYLKRVVLPRVSKKIAGIGVAGLGIENSYKRYYPASEINGQTIGFTNIDEKGISGIEKTYNDWLTGTDGKKQVIKDRAGHVIEFVKDIQVAKPGSSLTLSIDGDIQYLLYHSLKESYVQHRALSAQSVILDAKTGEVLAMASLPGFNPNNRQQLTGQSLRNRVVMDRIEPGSPIKPFIIAKALDLGVLLENELINTSPGFTRVQGQKITDTKNHGNLTAAGILKKSSNVGVSKVSLKMSAKQQWQIFEDAGFGQDLGLFLPGEYLNFVKPPEQWQKAYQAYSSFGYGFNINLMQLARAYTIFTNKGVLKPITLLKIEEKVNQKEEGKPVQVISKDVANKVLKMLEAATKKGGTAPKAKVDGYRVAGKTGTVHTTKTGGYEKNQYVSLFVGIVPASNPKYIMATVVNEPSRGVYYGGLVAAPVFKSVMQDVLRLKNIAPDNSATGEH